MPGIVVVSVEIGVGGYLCLRAWRDWFIGTAVLYLWHTPIVYNLAADDMDRFIVFHLVSIDPIDAGLGFFVGEDGLLLR